MNNQKVEILHLFSKLSNIHPYSQAERGKKNGPMRKSINSKSKDVSKRGWWLNHFYKVLNIDKFSMINSS